MTEKPPRSFGLRRDRAALLDLDALAERAAHVEHRRRGLLAPAHPGVHARLLLLRRGLHHLLEPRPRRFVQHEEFLHARTVARSACRAQLRHRDLTVSDTLRSQAARWLRRRASTAHAQSRPSAIAHTTSEAPRRASPATNTPGTFVAYWPSRCCRARRGGCRAGRRAARVGAGEAEREDQRVARDAQLGAGQVDELCRRAARRRCRAARRACRPRPRGASCGRRTGARRLLPATTTCGTRAATAATGCRRRARAGAAASARSARRGRALAERGAEAVAARVAAAEDDDALAGDRSRVRPGARRRRPGSAAVR